MNLAFRFRCNVEARVNRGELLVRVPGHDGVVEKIVMEDEVISSLGAGTATFVVPRSFDALDVVADIVLSLDNGTSLVSREVRLGKAIAWGMKERRRNDAYVSAAPCAGEPKYP